MTNLDREKLAIARATLELVDGLTYLSPITKDEAMEIIKKHNKELIEL